MTDHERFNEILDKCRTKNASGRKIWSTNELSDADLVELYDIAPDWSYITERYADGYTIVRKIFERAGMEEPEEYGDYLEKQIDEVLDLLRGCGAD